jgi:hypothetical protein
MRAEITATTRSVGSAADSVLAWKWRDSVGGCNRNEIPIRENPCQSVADFNSSRPPAFTFELAMIPVDLLFLLFMSARAAKQEAKQFRADVPAIPPVPDRARWEAEHRVKPSPIGNGTRRAWLAWKAHQARRCIERDLATIDRSHAIVEQVKLEHICERVKVAFAIQQPDHVFYDPSDNRFWVYPE